MLDALNRAKRCRELAKGCRRLAAIGFSVRFVLVATVILSPAASGVALAQTTTPPSSTSSKVDDVSKWTLKQWNRAKAKWEQEAEKWADCRKQSEDQNLAGRQRWSFLASCMTPASTSSKIDDVSEWTSRQWNRAKAKWEQESEKWANCQRQSKDQNLTGRKSWSFLASCMTS